MEDYANKTGEAKEKAMNLEYIIRALRREQAALTTAIRCLELLQREQLPAEKRRGRPPAWIKASEELDKIQRPQ